MPISYDYFYNSLRKDQKQFNNLYVYSPTPSLYFPIELSPDLELAINSGNVEEVEAMMPEKIREVLAEIEKPDKLKIPIDEKIEQWLDWEGFRIYKNTVLTDFRNTLERMFPQLVLAIIIIVVGVAVFIMFRGMEGMIERASNAEAFWAANMEKQMQLEDRLLTLIEEGKIPIEVIRPPPPGV